MELVTLKKKLSTYVTEGGQIRNVNEELLFEVLSAWEEWPGSLKEFYSAIGFSYRQMAGLIGKAKKLKREGYFGGQQFKEVSVPEEIGAVFSGKSSQCQCIELETSSGQVIRFPQMSQLMEFLEKAG